MLWQTVQMLDIALDELGGSVVVFQRAYYLATNETPGAAETKVDRKDEADDVEYGEV